MKVLLVDDDPAIREALGQTLELEGLTPVLAGSFLAVKDHLTPTFDGVVVTDMRMPGREDEIRHGPACAYQPSTVLS